MRLSEFYKRDYKVSYLNCIRQYWKYEKNWSCIGNPKKQNILLYLDGCSARYTLPSGEMIEAQDSDIMFCPVGSEYAVEFFDFSSSDKGTIGVNFNLCSDAPLPSKIEKFSLKRINSAIFEIELLSRRANDVVMKYNNLISEILTALGEQTDDYPGRSGYGCIADGVNYLREHLSEDLSIESLAARCSISEVYFRRIFKECMGTSPSKYRLYLRLTRSVEYLRYTNISVSEIAKLLGFVDSSYFIKKFKENFSITPQEYRSNF